MDHLTPHQLFSPIHVAWLHRRHERREDIHPSNLDAIEAAYPDAVNDPLFCKYRANPAAARLRRKPGPKPMSEMTRIRLWSARFEMQDEVDRIRAIRRTEKAKGVRGELEPCYQASEIIARRYRFSCGGQWLYQRLSKLGMLQLH